MSSTKQQAQLLLYSKIREHFNTVEKTPVLYSVLYQAICFITYIYGKFHSIHYQVFFDWYNCVLKLLLLQHIDPDISRLDIFCMVSAALTCSYQKEAMDEETRYNINMKYVLNSFLDFGKIYRNLIQMGFKPVIIIQYEPDNQITLEQFNNLIIAEKAKLNWESLQRLYQNTNQFYLNMLFETHFQLQEQIETGVPMQCVSDESAEITIPSTHYQTFIEHIRDKKMKTRIKPGNEFDDFVYQCQHFSWPSILNFCGLDLDCDTAYFNVAIKDYEELQAQETYALSRHPNQTYRKIAAQYFGIPMFFQIVLYIASSLLVQYFKQFHTVRHHTDMMAIASLFYTLNYMQQYTLTYRPPESQFFPPLLFEETAIADNIVRNEDAIQVIKSQFITTDFTDVNYWYSSFAKNRAINEFIGYLLPNLLDC